MSRCARQSWLCVTRCTSLPSRGLDSGRAARVSGNCLSSKPANLLRSRGKTRDQLTYWSLF